MIPAAVGFGGNLGRPDVAFEQALRHLDGNPAIRVLAVSGLYRSAPWGEPDQPDFLNGVAIVLTRLSPDELLGVLRQEERRAGRRPDRRWGPRSLDLDLLWYGDVVRDGPELTVPHPRLPERSFVLEPLAEVAPAWRHPATGASAGEMLDELGNRATACEAIPGIVLGGRLEELPCRR